MAIVRRMQLFWRFGWKGASLWALLLGGPAWALDPSLPTSQYIVDRWGWSRALPEETVTDINQTPDGFLWVANANGLVRFNGSTATSSPWPVGEAVDRSLRRIAVDSQGTLWGVTVTGSVVRIPADAPHPSEGTAVQVVAAGDPGVRVPAWRAAILPWKDRVRIGNADGVTDQSVGRFPAAKHLLDERSAIGVGSDGSVWTGSADGKLGRWHPDGGSKLVAALPLGQIDRIAIGRRGRVWLRSRSLLLCWCEGILKTWPLPAGLGGSSAYEPLIEDAYGSVWLGGRGRVVRLRSGRFDSVRLAPDLDETPVTALFEDREGAIWIGTLTGELFRLRDSPITSFGRAEGLAGDAVNSIRLEVNGDIWAHSMNRGLTLWRGDRRGTIPMEAGNAWYSGRDRTSGSLVVGSGRTRWRLDGDRPTLVPDPHAARAGRVSGWWSNSENGQAYVSRSSGLYLLPSLLSEQIGRKLSGQGDWQLFALGPRGIIWGADRQQLIQVAPSGERVERPPGRLLDELIHSLLWDEQTQRLWVGTNRGLLTWDPATSAWGPRGLRSDSVFALQRDQDGAFWAATRNGIVRFLPSRWLSGRTEADLRLTRADGLRSVNFGMCRGQGSVLLPDGRLLFASLQGIAAVNPRRIPAPAYGPTPMITELQGDERVVPFRAPLQFAAGTSRIQISFDAFSVSTPQFVGVEYFLEGVDAQWQLALNRRSVQYNNLGPGAYRFRLRSSWADGSGVRETTLAWAILPLYYQTLWFRLAMIAGFAGLCWLWVRNRARAQSSRTAELEARVADRTRELESAKGAAESGARVKAEFLATMSHELRTPMNGVLGIAELLAGTRLDESQAELLSTLRASGESLLAVVNDILDLSKIDSGRMQLERLPVCLPQLMAEVCTLVRPMADRKQLTLGLTTEGTALEWIESDPARIRQILLNLLGNAIKFTPTGKVTLAAVWKPDAVVLSVQDSGIGIPADKIPMLFQNFVQVDSSTTRLYGGSGLGLAISRRLVEALEGTIGCTSSAGVGSTFTVELPVVPASAPVSRLEPAAMRLSAGIRVLVAEDNLTNQRVIVGLLRKIGIEATVVANGMDAVEACQRETFDLVLMDCQMPMLDGYGATRLILRKLGSAAPPIVALTAHALESDRTECLAAGMCGYLTKPIMLEQLRQAVAEWCGSAAR